MTYTNPYTQAARAEYSVALSGVLKTQFMPWQVRSFIVHNNATQDIDVYDDKGTDYHVPAGVTQTFNPDNTVTVLQWKTVAAATGYASIEVYNIPQPIGSNPMSGAQLVQLVSPQLTILGSPTVTLAPGQQISIFGTPTVQFAANQSVNIGTMPNVSITGNVNIGTMPNVTVSGSVTVTSGAITINNASPITVINPDFIATFVTLNNQTAAVTLTRSTNRLVIQPIISTLARGGLLTITAVDSTTQTYEFLENEAIQAFSVSPLSPIIPYGFDATLKNGAVVSVKFTGQCGFIVSY